MVIKARIENGIVKEILSATPFPPFHPDLKWVTADTSVKENWLYDSGASTFTAPPSKSLSELKSEALQSIRSKASVQITVIGEWTIWLQLNISNGSYGTVVGGSKSVLQHCENYRVSIQNQSNVYEDAVNLAPDKASIDVIVPVWDTSKIFSYTEVKNGA